MWRKKRKNCLYLFNQDCLLCFKKQVILVAQRRAFLHQPSFVLSFIFLVNIYCCIIRFLCLNMLDCVGLVWQINPTYFNATVTYITHVTELGRFFKTPLYSVNFVHFTTIPPFCLEAEHCKYIMRRFEPKRRIFGPQNGPRLAPRAI